MNDFFAYRLPAESTPDFADCSDIYIYVDDPSCTEVAKYFDICTFHAGKSHRIRGTRRISLAELKHIFDDGLSVSPVSKDTFVSSDSMSGSFSTTQEEYMNEVAEIRRHIEAGDVIKVVSARQMVVDISIDIVATFRALCESYPHAMVFCYYSSDVGMWMGATPEILLRGDSTSGDKIGYTMALAGTRPAGTTGGWDTKNIEEQQIVADFISDLLTENNVQFKMGKTCTLIAGPVEHLCTVFRLQHFSRDLAILLSPTPALCGLPRDKAEALIHDIENFERGCYGGFCGPVDPTTGDFDYYVNLRSMRIYPRQVTLYAGGGIVADSDPYSEWIETERKASTLLSHLHPYVSSANDG